MRFKCIQITQIMFKIESIGISQDLSVQIVTFETVLRMHQNGYLGIYVSIYKFLRRYAHLSESDGTL